MDRHLWNDATTNFEERLWRAESGRTVAAFRWSKLESDSLPGVRDPAHVILASDPLARLVRVWSIELTVELPIDDNDSVDLRLLPANRWDDMHAALLRRLPGEVALAVLEALQTVPETVLVYLYRAKRVPEQSVPGVVVFHIPECVFLCYQKA